MGGGGGDVFCHNFRSAYTEVNYLIILIYLPDRSRSLHAGECFVCACSH